MFNARGIFFDNPVAKMDTRIQMRGNRPMVVWVLYLGLLTLIAGFAYWAVADSAHQSAVSAQNGLRGLNWTIMVTLSALVLLTAPALTAATMAAERQRRSLELIFSTPASPTLYTWGKLVSAYRNVWVLLVLAIPIAAVGYVMGGGTWLDMLASFMIVSYNGLLLCAAAMAAASISNNPIGAIVLAYALGAIMQLGLTILSAVGLAPLIYGGGTGNANPLGAFNAFFAVAYAPARTQILGVAVPTFIPAGVIVFLASLVIVMGASSGMTRFASNETKTFRAVLIALAAAGGLFCAIEPNLAGPGYTGLLMPLAVVFGLILPMYACFEPYGEEKNRDDGFFNVRRLLVGCPSSALPFTLTLLALLVVPSAVRHGYADLTTGTSFASFSFGGSASTSGPNWTTHILPAAYLFVFVSFLWIACRVVSRYTNTLGAARVLGVVAFVIVSVVPFMFTGYINNLSGGNSDIWRAAPMTALLCDPSMSPTPYLAHILVGTLVTMGLLVLEVRMRKSRPPVVTTR